MQGWVRWQFVHSFGINLPDEFGSVFVKRVPWRELGLQWSMDELLPLVAAWACVWTLADYAYTFMLSNGLPWPQAVATTPTWITSSSSQILVHLGGKNTHWLKLHAQQVCLVNPTMIMQLAYSHNLHGWVTLCNFIQLYTQPCLASEGWSELESIKVRVSALVQCNLNLVI